MNTEIAVSGAYKGDKPTVPTWLRFRQGEVHNLVWGVGDTVLEMIQHAMESAAIVGLVGETYTIRATRGVLGAETGFADLCRGISAGWSNMHVSRDGEEVTFYGEAGYHALIQGAGGVHSIIGVFSRHLCEHELARLIAATCEHVPPVRQGGEQYLLLAGPHGYQALQSRSLALPIAREHYAPAVMEKYGHVASQLAADEPEGRLVLIEGVPGTGKTFLCRGLFDSVRGAAYLMVQSSIIEDLTGPILLKALLAFHEENRAGGKKIVLVLEDGDECVREREPGKEGPVAALLALSDGLLGHVLDLRIVVTTNKKIDKMDPGVLRDGCLLARIDVGPLDIAHGARLVASKAGVPVANAMAKLDKHTQGLPPTLGQVFAVARQFK